MAETTKCAASFEEDGVHVSIVAYLKYGEELPQAAGEAEPIHPRSAYESLTAAVNRYIRELFEDQGHIPQPVRLPMGASLGGRSVQKSQTLTVVGP
jgi:hypothetical protein